MAQATEVLEIPTEHVACLRDAIKGEIGADCHDLPNLDPRPDDFRDLPRIEMHRALLDQLGWDDDDDSPAQVQADPDYLTAMLASAMATVSSRIAGFVGEYKDDEALDVAAAKRSARDLLWLIEAQEDVCAEGVAA